MNQIINPVNALKGTVRIPGDKSISHRSLMFGALARGRTRVSNLMPGMDVRRTRTMLEQLGVRIEDQPDGLLIEGCGLHGFTPPREPLESGNSGTTMRLMSGILAAQPFDSVLTGDASLSKRPMKRVITPLSMMGAEIVAREGFTAPLSIHGRNLQPVHYHSPVASAQIKSCVLLAGLHTPGITAVTEPALSRDHTERMLSAFGVEVTRSGLTVSVQGPAALSGTDIQVPGDISAAAFFWVAAAIAADAEIVIKNVGLNPTRTGILTVLEAMGCPAEILNPGQVGDEPVSDLLIRSAELRGTVLGGDLIPRLVDEIPAIAIAALFAEGETRITDAAELRVKETDRIAALETNIRRMGGHIETFSDGFSITGPQKLHGAEIETFHDHRIAMAFAVAGLRAEGQTVIRNAEIAEISHPGFYNDLQGLCHV